MKPALILSLLLLIGCQASEQPVTTIALVADVQHADKPDAGARHYRLSLQHLPRL